MADTLVWEFTQEQIDACLHTCLDPIPVRHRPEDALSLQEALRVVSGARVGLARLLSDCAREPFAARADDTLELTSLWFDRDVLLAYQERVRTADGQILLSVNAMRKRLNCKEVTLERLDAAGLLVPCQRDVKGTYDHWRYDPEDVAAFEERYITSDQAAEILECSRLTVQKWVRDGRLTAVTGPHIDGSHMYRFEREQLVAWRTERLTFGEAVAILGVNRSALYRWVKSGRLTPLTDMSGAQQWFARAEVEELARQRRG